MSAVTSEKSETVVVSKAIVLRALTLKEENVDVASLGKFSGEEVRKRMKERVRKIGERRPDSMAKL